jgi:type I restriction enzyme S subunit
MKGEATTALVPKLRFPEFLGADEWKPISLQEASTPVTERVGERKLTPVSISAGIGFVPQAAKFGRDISGKQYQLYTLVRDGDFVFNKGNSLKFPQGCIYQLQGWGHVAAPSVFICFRLKKGYSDSFFQQCFEQNQHGKQLRRHITSGARSNGLLNISKETFFSVEILSPSLAEQQKIAACLSSLDELIAAQAQKAEALKTHKKGLMQQLFPREGELQPRLRFLEFQNAGEWEETELGQCLEKVIDYRGKPPPKAESGVPLITAKNVRFGWLDMTNDEYIEADAYDSWMTKGIPTVGDILFTTEAPLGNVGMFPAEGTYALGQRIITLRCKTKKCIPEFLFQSLLGPELQERIDFHSTGSTAKGIKSSVFVTLAFRHPKVPEQQRIADFLSSLDFLISAENHKLEALMSHKKGLMQQLFPSTGGDEI